MTLHIRRTKYKKKYSSEWDLLPKICCVILIIKFNGFCKTFFLTASDVGLEAFCDDCVLLETVESLTCGKIFAVEILDKSDIPLVVLYDTSGEDDININATCLKALRDKSLELHLQVLPSSSFIAWI